MDKRKCYRSLIKELNESLDEIDKINNFSKLGLFKFLQLYFLEITADYGNTKTGKREFKMRTDMLIDLILNDSE